MASYMADSPEVLACLKRLGYGSTQTFAAKGVATAMTFFRDKLGWDLDHSVPEWPQHKSGDSYIECMDLHSPIYVEDLKVGDEVVSYRWMMPDDRSVPSPFGDCYTLVGTSKYDVGIKTQSRLLHRFVVRRRVPALWCRAAHRIPRAYKAWPWPGVDGRGGAVQIMIPRPADHLRISHVQHAPR